MKLLGPMKPWNLLGDELARVLAMTDEELAALNVRRSSAIDNGSANAHGIAYGFYNATNYAPTVFREFGRAQERER